MKNRATGAIVNPKDIPPNRRMALQVQHIQEHQAAFNEHQVSDTDVDVWDYFMDNCDVYDGGHTATYVYLCSDLGIEPNPLLLGDWDDGWGTNE